MENTILENISTGPDVFLSDPVDVSETSTQPESSLNDAVACSGPVGNAFSEAPATHDIGPQTLQAHVKALRVVPTGQTAPPAAGESLDDVLAPTDEPDASKVSPVTYLRASIGAKGEPVVTALGVASDAATISSVENFLRVLLVSEANPRAAGNGRPTNPLRVCKVDAEVFAKAAVLALDDGRRSYVGIAPPKVGEEFRSARELAQRLGYSNPSTISNALTVSKSIGGALVTLRGVSFCRKSDWLKSQVLDERGERV